MLKIKKNPSLSLNKLSLLAKGQDLKKLSMFSKPFVGNSQRRPAVNMLDGVSSAGGDFDNLNNLADP